jgi:cyclase
MLSRRVRVIPTLLIDRDGRLVKTVRFGKRSYIGDPINAVRIFNTKQVDELVLIDIDASADGRDPDYERLADIAAEAFMPVAYGGGLMSEDHIARTLDCGLEKIVLSSALSDGTALIERAVSRWGGQSVTVCLPYGKNWRGKEQIRLVRGKRTMKSDPEAIARQITAAGVGEIIVYSIDRDGTWQGYDLDMLTRISNAIDVPVVACGGASKIEDFQRAICEGGCAAVAAGSLFVYQAKGRGVLISYPAPDKLLTELFDRI